MTTPSRSPIEPSIDQRPSDAPDASGEPSALEASDALDPSGAEEVKPRASRSPFPPWLTIRVPCDGGETVQACLDDLDLGTVCRSARCPNARECYKKGRATFLLMGPSCTRHCGFCAVDRHAPAPLSSDEPERVAEAVARLELRHAVITSVTRDDLPDGGAAHFAATVAAVRARRPEATIEILTPDFAGDRAAWGVAADARPDVFNHNLETVPRLYETVRPEADYRQSLDLLRFVKDRHPDMTTKSGLMVGLGETWAELLAVGADLRAAGVDMVTVGQYLKPGGGNLPVVRFMPPAEFEDLRAAYMELGFRLVAAAPLVRSSYNAEEALFDMRALESHHAGSSPPGQAEA